MANNFQQGFKEQKIKTSANIQKFLTDPLRFRRFIVGLASVALLVGIVGLVMSLILMSRGTTPITTLQSGTDGNSANFTEGSIADVANKVTPSVVSIVTETSVQSFFGESSGQAAGTGIIVSSDGYILTNKHVISGAKTIQVVTSDGQIFENASVTATDPLNDVAFIKVNGSDLKAANLGDSKTITAGQQVVAIGNALGEFQNTITSGIVSGTGRSLTASDGSSTSSTETLTDMIQTDAAINSGNSGGPLINAAGEVIGINTATSSSANSIGFAIPISSIKGMLKGILENGKGERAYIGVRSISVTPEVATSYDLPVNSGAYVLSESKYTAIIKDSPAAKAGLQEKDIITKVNTATIGVNGSLSSLISEYKPGDTIQLTVIRGGNTITLNVTLEAYKTTSNNSSR